MNNETEKSNGEKMIIESLIAFICTITLLVVTPGSNTALLLKNVPVYGRGKGFLNLLGIVSAVNVHGLLAIFGVSSILLVSSILFSLLKIAGAIYLCIIGIQIIINSFKTGAKDKPNPDRKLRKRKTVFSHGYIEGLVTNLLNPKPALFYVAVFSQFFKSEAPFIEVYFLVLIHSTVALIWYSIVIIGIQQIKEKVFLSGIVSNYF